MSEKECPVCGRLDFVGLDKCAECGWPLKPIHCPDGEKVFGCDVMVEVTAGMVATEKKSFHFKGNETTARRRSKMAKGFVRVLAVDPLSETVWKRAYGDGREKWG